MKAVADKKSGIDRLDIIMLLGAPALCAVIVLTLDLDPVHPEVTRMAAVAILMAIWWIAETLPLAITSLLPVILFPTLGIMSGKNVAPIYFNHVIFLFIGGFIVALSMERWNLHKRIALRTLMFFGVRPRGILFGLMIATWFLSMWISNTATTMMMVPIVLSIIIKLEESMGKPAMSRYAIGFLLAVAYSSSIGGVATLVGTPPNLSFARIFAINFPNAPEISFAGWFTFALPLSAVVLVIVWLMIGFIYFRGKTVEIDASIFREEYRRLGPLSVEEAIVLADFIILALLWLTRRGIKIGSLEIHGWSDLFSRSSYINDGTVAIAMAVLLFMIPSKTNKGSMGRIMDWETASKLPWNIVLLFGGGFALATGFKKSGLSMWIGHQLSGISHLHPILIIGLICLVITFLTEFTSNTATAEMFLPVLASLAIVIRVNPLLLMIPATLSASFAFMMPVATPPNAIIFGTERLRIRDMARTGFFINIIGVLIVTMATYLVATRVFSIDLSVFPQWAINR